MTVHYFRETFRCACWARCWMMCRVEPGAAIGDDEAGLLPLKVALVQVPERVIPGAGTLGSGVPEAQQEATAWRVGP